QGDQFEIGVTLNNIANIYNELNRPDEAILYANRCLSFARQLTNKYVLGRALNNLGVSYFKKNDFAKSIAYQNKSLGVKIESVDLLGEAYSLSDLGEVYFAKKDFSKALAYFQKALTLWKNLHDSYGISKTTLNLGKVYAAKGFWEEAESSFTISLLEAKNNQNKKNVAQAYLALSSLYETKQDYQRALEMHKLYSLVSDSLLNTATSDKIAELRVISEFDEKEKEVELLTKEKKIQSLEIEKQLSRNKIFLIIAIAAFCILLLLVFRFIKIRRLKILLEEKNKAISQKSKELEEANAAKDKFFSILAHDLKSPFTGLLGYSEILSEEFDSMEHDEKIKTFGYLKNLIERVYTLIENLLDWSRIQTNRIEITPVVINLSTEVPEILMLFRANAEMKQIATINQIMDPISVFADSYSFRSIMQNLVSNSIKFTYPQGTIIISAKEKIDFVEISINDSGIGIEPELLERIFKIETRHSTKGTAEEAGTGLGLLLCKELAEKNSGSITIQSTVGVGTTICVSLPKAKEKLSNPPRETD
ncbi:MAG: tetratricopeptide repeat-containing sensor histidine kinase, partial [Ignavibacteriaceae bacterium]